jgi:hypothetical protein
MALRGNLRDFSITQLLNLVSLARKTGTLTLSANSTKTRLCFKGGRLVYATVNGRDDRLAALLRKAGLVTEEQARAIESQTTTTDDKDLGLLLINAGYVTKGEIINIVRADILESAYPLITWTDGTFTFDSNLLPFEDRILVPVNLESVILEGSRRMQESEHLQQELPDLDLPLKFADRPDRQLRNINLSVDEWRVISFINSRNTIREVAQYNGLSEFRIRRIVYGLLQAHLVELVRSPVSTHREAVQEAAAPARPVPRAPVKRGIIVKLIDFFQRP